MRASKLVTLIGDLPKREEAVDIPLRQLVQEALDDPRTTIPAETVFADLRAHHEARLRTAEREA